MVSDGDTRLWVLKILVRQNLQYMSLHGQVVDRWQSDELGQFAARHLIDSHGVISVMFLPRYYQEYLQEALNAIKEDGVKMLGPLALLFQL